MGFVDVDTDAGRLRGAELGALKFFLGVPYGASTAGANRFRPPQPVTPWEGVREAVAFGPACPQSAYSESPSVRSAKMGFLQHPVGGTALEGGEISEDCLHLNVWAPAATTSPTPVLVWLHGGGFMFGSGNEGWFNGDILATAENIIVVTVTHRLGLFGFLDLDGAPGYSPNAGMLDIVAALQWVSRNIAAFGGDPSRVTIAGHSGGAAKVAALLAMPVAKGLFHNAIMQSGPITQFHSSEETAALRKGLLDALDNPPLSALKDIPVDILLRAQEKVLAGISGTSTLGESSAIPGFAPSTDETLPNGPFDGATTDVSLMIGCTAHEIAAFLLDAPFFTQDLSDAAAVVVLEQFAGQHAGDLYSAAAAISADEPPHLRLARALGIGGFEQGTDAIARAVNDGGGLVWQYRFDQTTEALDGLLGACHAIEIPYVFGTIDRTPLTGRAPGRHELSCRMMQAWASFVRDGKPALASEWQSWTPDNPYVRHFSIASTRTILHEKSSAALAHA
ncbi:carboxylesterase/lipase family protein [Paenarthrobacter nicotinovorans]|uniref:carboxylesterase/lipase family protein n=1 Tax=Paenarthrobacter nicotinovorans TaxID=29320 RepID=UPI003747F64F